MESGALPKIRKFKVKKLNAKVLLSADCVYECLLPNKKL